MFIGSNARRKNQEKVSASSRAALSIGIDASRHRGYSPTLMRWVQQDPLGYVDGLDRYVPLNNNPVKKTDPSGLLPQSLTGAEAGRGSITYTIGNLSNTSVLRALGQSFTPTVKGDGTGILDCGDPVRLISITVGYFDSDARERAPTLYLYADEKPMLSNIAHGGTNSFATSYGYYDDNAFGPGSFTRTFLFKRIELETSKKYFFVFSTEQLIRYATGNPYSGGELLSTTLSDTTFDAQFEVKMTND